MIRSKGCDSFGISHFFNFVKMVGFGPHVCDYQKFCWIINIINKIFWPLLLLCSSCIYHVMCVGVHGHVIVLNADSISETFPLSEHFFAKSSTVWVFWFWTISGFCPMYSMWIVTLLLRYCYVNACKYYACWQIMKIVLARSNSGPISTFKWRRAWCLPFCHMTCHTGSRDSFLLDGTN